MAQSLIEPWILAVRVRRLLVRPVVRRGLVAAVALITGLTVAGLVRSAEQARDRWGTERSVVVARRDLAPGEAIEPHLVESRQLPEIAVPDGALSDAPLGAVVHQPVAEGEQLVASRLAPDGLTGVAALVPEDHRAIALPVGPAGMPPVQVGDRVDVLAVMPTTGDLHGHPEPAGGLDDDRAAATPAVEDALVVDVSEQAVSIAVPIGDATAVAAILTHGVALLALAGA